MAKTIVFLFLFVSLCCRIEAKAFPGDSQEIVGFNLGGLTADLKTNLFAPDGPLAQLGNEITSGASQLEDELNSGAQAMQADFNNAANFLSQGSLGGAAGGNSGGFKVELDTNLFSDNGPFAHLGGELESGAKDLEKNLEDGANQLSNSLSGAANQLQADLTGGADFLTKGLQDLGNQISSSGGASLDSLLQGNGDLFANLGINTGSYSKGGESDTLTITGKSSGSPQTQSSGSTGLSIFGDISGGLPQFKSQVTKTSTSGGQPEGRSLSGFTINVASGQNSGKSSSSGMIGADSQGGGGGVGRIIVSKTGSPQTQSSGSSGLSIFGQISGGFPQVSSQVTKTSTSQGQPEGRSLSGFTINVASGQNSGKSSSSGKTGADSSGGGEGNGRIIVTKTITSQNPVLTPEILAELSKTLKLPDLCKALKS